MNAMQILIGFLVYKKGRFSGDYLPPGVQIPFIDKKPETCSFSFSASAPFLWCRARQMETVHVVIG